MTKNELAKFIDHTLLKPTASKEQILKLCSEAIEYGFASVCVNPCNVEIAKEALSDSDVKVCSVIGFPFGAHSTEVKLHEANKALADGASELDMVINVGKLLEENVEYVTNEIKLLANTCHSNSAILKVIVETCFLDESGFKYACQAVENGGADFIKTSTGYGSRGADENDILLFKKFLKKQTKIKASGGIRSFEDAKKYIDLGCNRIGASSGIKIIEGLK